MNQWGIVIKRIFLLCVSFLLVSATGCVLFQTKATGGQEETAIVAEGEKDTAIGVNEELHRILMDFADSFASEFGAVTTTLLSEQELSPKRRYAAMVRFYMLTSAFEIASERYPSLALVDMVVLMTLGRITWEEYWQPEVYGDPAQEVVKTLRGLEKQILAIAARVLTPEQVNELGGLIRKWREKHPDQQHVAFIRFSTISEVLDEGSVLEKETRPGGLFAPITEATEAVDEIRFSAERAIYLVSRIQATAGMQVEMVYHNLATQPEGRQLLSDITGFREAVEQLPEQISRERKELVRELESKERLVRGVLADIRQTMREGNDLVSLVNETAKTVDSTATRIDAMIRLPAEGKPFDILEYHNAVLAASAAAEKFQSLLDSMERFVASPHWEQRMPGLLGLADSVQSEVIEKSITHAFIYGAALILIFFMALLLTLLGHRYASMRLSK